MNKIFSSKNEYIGYYNIKTKRVSKIYEKKNLNTPKNSSNYILFHSHPNSKICKNNIPSYQDILFTIEHAFPVHFIFIKDGIYILKKELKDQVIPTYSQVKLCTEKNIIKKLNNLFQFKNLSFQFISYQEINTSLYSKELEKIIQKFLKMVQLS